jgi:hypothetical protein
MSVGVAGLLTKKTPKIPAESCSSWTPKVDTQKLGENIGKGFDKTKDFFSGLGDKIKGFSTKMPEMAGGADKAWIFFKENWCTLLFIAIVITAVMLYFLFVFMRVPRYLSSFTNRYSKKISLGNLSDNPDIINGNYVLSDFYVASSYKSYLPCQNYLDYSSIDAITTYIQNGARYIDLDIWNKDFNPCTDPVVCAGQDKGSWKLTNYLDFDEVCRAIVTTAFSQDQNNYNDPLFLNLNLHLENNYSTMDKIAVSIRNHFREFLLDSRFSFCGKYSSTSLPNSPIKSLFRKVIIICDNDTSYSLLDEIVNLSANVGGNLRSLTYQQIIDLTDMPEQINWGKRSLTRVYQPVEGRSKENGEPTTAINLGCQFICMNYSLIGDEMDEYIEFFKNNSLVLKPLLLRYQPTTIPAPLQQTPKVSFAPKVAIAGGVPFAY